jgi:hypothetical protein
MKIHFCDLCNESVPEADFAVGRAFRRQGRIVCATCDSIMSVHGPGPGAGAVTAAGGPAPAGTAVQATGVGASGAGASSAETSTRGAWIGAAALLFAAVSAWIFSGELSRLRDQEHASRTGIEEGLRAVGRDLDEFSLRGQRRDDELEGRLRATLAERQAEIGASLAALREEIRTRQKQLDGIDAALARLGEDVRDGELAAGRRIDDLLAQSMKSRQALDSLASRLQQTEVAQAQRGTSGSVPVPQPQGPKYAAQIGDLASNAASTRWNAVQSLGETGDPEVVPFLVPLLADSDVFVRMAVARVFGDLASPLAIEPLIEALEDEESVMREAAMAALHIITGRDFRFDPFAKPAERAKRVEAWRAWWKKAKDEYFGDL